MPAKIQPHGYRVLIEWWSEYVDDGGGGGGRDFNALGVFVEKITSSSECARDPFSETRAR
jgi:hypothetical protein